MAKKKPKALEPERSLARRAGKQNPLPGIFIFSEGELTEPEYITNYFREKGDRRKVALSSIQRGAGSPLTIVEACVAKLKELKQASKTDSFEKFSQVWAVFDIDVHPKIEDAIRLADETGVRYAISNPCIEVWGLMHFGVYERPGSRHEAQDILAKKMPGYHHDKSPIFPWDVCRDKVDDAILNSEIALRRREKEEHPHPKGNPTTNFQHLLLELSGKTIEELEAASKSK